MFDINFESSELQFPCHPRHQAAADLIKSELAAQGLTNHFVIFSSGTTSSDLKGYALSREALFANAQAVNEHFNLTATDVWGLSLPHFHVGGLSVLARAHLLKSRLVDLGNWQAKEWVEKLSKEKVTVTTVVPTQVYDLVENNCKSPSKLKNLIVGGDFLAHELEKRAMELGWPIIRTFGMTEVCSQLASARKPLGALEILPIHTAKIDESGRLSVKSKSLFTLQFKFKEKLEITYAKDLCDVDGFYQTNDLAEIFGKSIMPLGRIDDQIKVDGKLISFNSLKDTLYRYALENDCYGKVELIIETDERRGKEIVLLHLPKIGPIPSELFAPIKITTREVISFNRTDLGKLKK